MKMHKVQIDGIDYVPLHSVIPSQIHFIKALLSIFWGSCSSDDMEYLKDRMEDLRIIVSDSEPKRGITFEEITLKEKPDPK
jgi:hypothetical protein